MGLKLSCGAGGEGEAGGSRKGHPAGAGRIGPVPDEVEVRLQSLAERGMCISGNHRELLCAEVKEAAEGKA